MDAVKYQSWNQLFVAASIVVLLQVLGGASVAVPRSNCYALDNSSRLVDFTSYIGRLFEYEEKDSDLVVRFCKDVESRSQAGYIDFGRFDETNYFAPGSGHIDFIQGYYRGDLINCERTYSKLGRTAQVNIICGSCPNGQCKGELGCICNVTYESSCRAIVELAMPCEKHGLRVFEGFTLGFHPRSWEIVYNGMTQLGYEKAYGEFSFSTELRQVALHMTAVASLSRLVQKPTFKVVPESGLEVRLSGSGAMGKPPTTLSPSVLMVDWTCEVARDTPYEVVFTIPIENYEPIQFTLTKMCDYQQNREKEATKGWAVFGVFSFVFMVCSTLFCCGGLIYKARFQNQRGLDALPGVTFLSACLQAVTEGNQSYPRAEDYTNPFVNQASWRGQKSSDRGTGQQHTQVRYGTI